MFFVNFVNKGFDYIQLSSILHEPLVVESLPDNLKNDDVPSIVYRLSNTVRNKILNYKQTVTDIDVTDFSTCGTGYHLVSVKNPLLLMKIMVIL